MIETSFDIGGYPVVVTDTAGIRQKSEDVIENEGIKRAKNSSTTADLLIIVIDAIKLIESEEKIKEVQNYLENHYVTHLGLDKETLKEKKVLTIINKIDLIDVVSLERIKSGSSICISCTENIGFTTLIEKLSNELEQLCGNPSTESLCVSQARHRHHLTVCLQNIEEFLQNYSENSDLSILVQKLRNSIRSIGHIVGAVRTDDILDVIFKDFCIGK